MAIADSMMEHEGDDRSLDLIVDFVQRYGEPHAMLCMHAALPLGLTPELLHLIRYNFVRQAPRIAEADLLLSALCHDVGAGFYQMRSSVRELLIFELQGDVQFGRARIEDLSELLLAYVQRTWRTAHDKELRSFLLAQKWTALAYLDPAEAARQLAAALAQEIRGPVDSDVVRIASITQGLSAPLYGEEHLLNYAAGVERVAFGQTAAAARFFQALGSTSVATSIHGVQLPAPDALLRAARMRQAGDAEREETPETSSAANKSWPTAADYLAALQSSLEHDLPAELQGTIERQLDGRPRVYQGAFAIVFCLRRPNGERIALRVFQQPSDIAEHYEALAEHLADGDLPASLLPFKFWPTGLRFPGGRRFPLLQLPWYDGSKLMQWVATCCEERDSERLQRMAEKWSDVIAALEERRIAHGDLQPANILVGPDDDIKLVDYDGMCVPALQGRSARECGVLPYQHPGRTSQTALSLDIDRFGAIVIHASLRILALHPELHSEFAGDSENYLLFRPDDMRCAEHRLLATLLTSPHAEVRDVTRRVLRLWDGPFEQVPRLEEFEQLSRPRLSLTKPLRLFASYVEADREHALAYLAKRAFDEEITLVGAPKAVASMENTRRPEIKQSDQVVVFWSAAADESRFLRAEVSYALNVCGASRLHVVVLGQHAPPLPLGWQELPRETLDVKSDDRPAWTRPAPDDETTRRILFTLAEAARIMGMSESATAEIIEDDGSVGDVQKYSQDDIIHVLRDRGGGFTWAYISCAPSMIGFVEDNLIPALRALGIQRFVHSGNMQEEADVAVLRAMEWADIHVMLPDGDAQNQKFTSFEWYAVRRTNPKRAKLCVFARQAIPFRVTAAGRVEWHRQGEHAQAVDEDDFRDFPIVENAADPAVLAADLQRALVPQLSLLREEITRGCLYRVVSNEAHRELSGSLETAMQVLCREHAVNYEFEAGIDVQRTVTLRIPTTRLRSALRVLLHPLGLTFRIRPQGILVTAKPASVLDVNEPFAVVSDILGNLWALDAVLEDLDRQGIRQICNLGNTAGPPYSTECLAIAQGFQTHLLGAFDQGMLFDPDGFSPLLERAVFWARAELESRQGALNTSCWDFLAESPRLLRQSGFTFVNGTARNPVNEELLPEDIYNTRKFERVFAMVDKVCFCGKTGVPGVFLEDSTFLGLADLGADRKFSLDDRKAIINVGSVGFPRDGDTRACYAIVSEGEVRFRRVPYDVNAAVKNLRQIPDIGAEWAAALSKGGQL